MDTEDVWMLALVPLATIAFIWAVTTGECKRTERGTFKECATESAVHFGEGDVLYEDKIRAFTGDEK